ncbi:MAG: DUF5050 domain-containing protein, partial [Clostridiales bacterium]|nr:DUF5050 domain-containing protein [Clostridiales bacterium]
MTPQALFSPRGYKNGRMKKRLFLITALILFLLLSSCSDEDESVYFEMLTHGASIPLAQHRVFHTDGRGGYSVVYTFEDTPRPLTAIEDHYLYYAPGVGNEGQPTALHRVDLTTGEDIVFNEMEYRHASHLAAYGGELYFLCDSFDTRDKSIIYRITRQDTVRCSDSVASIFAMSFAVEDGSLYYISRDDPHSLMKVDLGTLEISMISEKPGFTDYFGYSDGRVYGQFTNECYSVSVQDGEMRLEEENIASIFVHDGWLYCSEFIIPREKGPYGTPNSRLYARNLKTGKIRDYGTIFIDGFYRYLSSHLTFGKNGFVVTRPNAFSDQGWETLNQYYY